MRKTLVALTIAGLMAVSALTGSSFARDRMDRVALTANQITDQISARTARIKADLRLTPEQEQNWSGFESVMGGIGKTQADRQIAMQAEPAPQKNAPVDTIDQMRKDADFMSERAAEQKKLADAAQPLYASLNDQQKRHFGEALWSLSRWPDAD